MKTGKRENFTVRAMPKLSREKVTFSLSVGFTSVITDYN